MRGRVLVVTVVAAAVAAASPGAAAAARAQPHCGDTLVRSVTLTQDLDCGAAPAGTVGLTIGADDVTLDLGGHRLSGVGGVGIGVSDDGFDGATIRNGAIVDFGNAVVLRDAADARLKTLRGDATNEALLLDGAQDATLASVSVQGDLYGLDLEGSDGVRIADSSLVGQSAGLVVDDSDGTTVARTTMSGEDGLSLFGSDDSRIADSRFIAGFDAVRVTGSDNLLARDTFIAAQLGFGRSLVLTGDRNVVRDGTVSLGGFSPQPEFDVVSGSANVLRRNTLSGPVGDEDEKDGILVRAAALDTLLADNSVSGYFDDGIEVDSASTTLRRNAANDNGDLGIEAIAGVRGRGNTASGNGNPAQCSGIVCG